MSKELVLFVIRRQFGPAFGQLLSPLIDHEELMLSEIANDSKLDVNILRPMLILLLKHSIIEFNERLIGGKPTTFYRMNSENVLNISMYPRYLAFFEDKVSVLSKSIVENLMLGGMMTVEEILQVTKDNLGMELEDEDIKDQDILQEVGTLVTLNYFVPVHKTAALQPPDSNEDASLGKRKTEADNVPKMKSAKKIKSSKNFLIEDTLEAGKLIDMYKDLT